MPTISIKRDALFEALGKTYNDDEFQDLCFKFGLELDEVTSERQILEKEQGVLAAASISDEILYKIDIPANRYDLLCLEGLVTGLLVFLGKISPPQYHLEQPVDSHSLHLTPATAQIRPYAVAAVLKNITFTKESYNSFIDLQDKLHQNICRKRSLVAIGTHDLDSIHGPFVYDALPPEQIKFKALNQNEEMTAPQLMELYSSHVQLKQYLGIIHDSPVYPIIKDSNGVVLSMPPIINGDHSKITLNTKNVFIECTATDLTKAIIVLDTIVCMFSKYCVDQYHVQQCKVYSPSGSYDLYPHLTYRTEVINVDRALKYIGIQKSSGDIANLLTRMCLKSESQGDAVSVQVPPSRHDVIHACDIYEDIAIAYGYNNIERRPCKVLSTGSQQPITKFTMQLRDICANAGYTEVLTFILCSEADITTKLRNKCMKSAVRISNPKAIEFQVARTTLLPGLMKTLASNKNLPLPIKIFEIADVVLKDDTAESGARNERRLCALITGRVAPFEMLHGLLDHVMMVLGLKHKVDYYLQSTQDDKFLPGCGADVIIGEKMLGYIGILHPEVMLAFELPTPCCALEITLNSFV